MAKILGIGGERMQPHGPGQGVGTEAAGPQQRALRSTDGNVPKTPCRQRGHNV